MNKKIKVLYVDDEELNTQLFRLNFQKMHEVLTADDGFNALEVLDRHPDTDIVISDMKMPGMNGVEFIRTAREKFPDKKYYILTGFEITNEIREAINAGLILKYFRKPFNIQEIESALS